MNNRIEPIPTILNGVLYKSRLEMRFFQWARQNSTPAITQIYHEPHRIGRNQYLPDFRIVVPSLHDEVYIEVKPFAFAKEAWLAVDAACETGCNMMVVDDFGRDDWRCFASVSESAVEFFSTLRQHALRLEIPPDRHRPVYCYNSRAA